MGLLHELLAVEPDLRNGYDAVRSKISDTLKARGLFDGRIRTYQPVYEEGTQFPDEVEDPTVSVGDQLTLLRKTAEKYFDAVYQKELTNTEARGDIIIHGETLAENVPATMLLGLESKLAHIRQVLKAIPTLDPAERWEWDGGNKEYRSAPKTQLRTEKRMHSFVGYEATEHHPAQIETYTTDDPVGTWTTIRRSLALPYSEKQRLIEQCEVLIRAVKQARQRANQQEVALAEIGSVLFDFINVG